VGAEDGLRQALVAAALDILEVEGAEPSLRAVARAAGVSAMAPYRHFADKAALLAAVASRGFELLRDALAEADDQPDAGEALFAQGMAFVAFARAHPALFRLMYSHRYGHADTDAVRATAEILARRVARVTPAHPAAAALACRAMAQGLAAIALNARLAPAQPDDVAVALRLLVAGLRAGF
jgi:AcrR family transcriptional regulator